MTKQLSWRDHINEVVIKLNRANAMLRKRVCINWHIQINLLWYICLNYSNLVRDQNKNVTKHLIISSEKRLINLKLRNFRTSPLYLRLNILKLPVKIFLKDCLLKSKAINNVLPFLFDDWFTFQQSMLIVMANTQ